jgi:hypothetical protein
MKLRDYYQKLQLLIRISPEALDMDVVYSTDDEGNAYIHVSYTPCVGYYKESDQEFYSLESSNIEYPRAVCLN